MVETLETDQLDSAILHRLNTLLRTHTPRFYADWQRLNHEYGGLSGEPYLEAMGLLMVATFNPLRKRFPELNDLDSLMHLWETYRFGTGAAAYAARRNERLLVRLLVRGCRLRGEVDPTLPSQPCPHCGIPNEHGADRCFSCERLIG